MKNMERPIIIGIIAKHLEKNGHKRQNALIRDEVKNAIFANGAIAIGILSPEKEIGFIHKINQTHWNLTKREQQYLIEQINLCDGIVLQGGRNSEHFESWVAKYTYDHDIPTLGICAGQNNMIRGLGGSVKCVKNQKKHNQMWVDYVHPIFIDSKSRFYKIVGCQKMDVNSRHIYTIKQPTENYRVAAVCDDGYFDVLEAPDKKFNFALRFHPESLFEKSPEHNKIFKAFIKACKENRKN